MRNNKKYYDTIIFDFDGVVIDSSPDIIDSTKYTLEHFKCDMKEDEYIKQCIGGGAKNLLLRCIGDSKRDSIDEICDFYKLNYLENCANKTYLYPGVNEILEYYNGKKNIAVATYKIRSATIKILDKLGVLKYFDVIITADDVKNPKPHPESIERILDKLGTKKENALMVGDTKTDVLTGKNSGIDVCGVLYGFGTEEELRENGAEFIVKDIRELRDIILLK